MTDPVTSYAKREPARRDDPGHPVAAQDPAAFGGLPEILNRSPRVQAQLQLDRTLNQGVAQRFRVKRPGPGRLWKTLRRQEEKP